MSTARQNTEAMISGVRGTSDTFKYNQGGIGAVDRSVSLKLEEAVSVKDFGAVGDGIVDDSFSIQSAINASPGKVIYFPKPSNYYRITVPLYIRTDRTVIAGESPATFIYQATPNIDAIVFEPTTAGITSAFLNAPQIRNIAVANVGGGTPTAGTCIKFRQCNGYRLFNVNTTSNGCLEGISIYGGQFGSLKSFTCSASSGGYAGDGTALLTFRRAPYASSRQPMYTVEVEDSRLTASALRGSDVLICDADGLHFTDAYWGFGKIALLQVQPEADTDYVSGTSLVNCYLDCVDTTEYGVFVADDGLTSSSIFDLTIGSGCVVGNCTKTAVYTTHPRLYDIRVVGAKLLNCDEYAVNINGNDLYTVALVTAASLQNNTLGGIRVNEARVVSICSNTFQSNGVAQITLLGSFVTGVISGNSAAGTVAELVNTATFSSLSPLVLALNTSPYSGANSWKALEATASLDFGSLTVGAQQTLTISLPGAVVGDNVVGNVQASTNVNFTGFGALILFSYGVTSANTVSVRAVNIGTATGDPSSLIFRVRIIR